MHENIDVSNVYPTATEMAEAVQQIESTSTKKKPKNYSREKLWVVKHYHDNVSTKRPRDSR